MKLQNYLPKLRKLLSKYKTIDDIIIFGSIVKGSSDPKDLDLALLLKNESDLRKIKDDIRLISKNTDIEIISSIYNSLWIVLIREGFSVRKNEFLHEIYKLEPVVLYKYSLKKLNPVQKVQFTRGLKEILKDTKSRILSRCIVLVPTIKKIGFDDFLSTWNLTYETQSYELFPIMRKGELI
ncbi:hypothetical protein J4480_03845 [Candidatus Woesearchaeota archaeon]|nr:hypothetical protein [Candidatus Woesearchaeota archaeon]